MKIILAIADEKKVNRVFITDDFKVLSLDEALQLALEGKIDAVHAVKNKFGTYLRTNRRVVKFQELDQLSIAEDQHYIQPVGWHKVIKKVVEDTTQNANNLIKKSLYNPNPQDPLLPFKSLNVKARAHLSTYLIQPKHSIYFAAALLCSLIEDWKPFIDLEQRPDILATLYHLDYINPHDDPHPNERGIQIATEFYELSKTWFKE